MLNLAMDTVDTLDPAEGAIFHSDQRVLYLNDFSEQNQGTGI